MGFQVPLKNNLFRIVKRHGLNKQTDYFWLSGLFSIYANLSWQNLRQVPQPVIHMKKDASWLYCTELNDKSQDYFPQIQMFCLRKADLIRNIKMRVTLLNESEL